METFERKLLVEEREKEIRGITHSNQKNVRFAHLSLKFVLFYHRAQDTQPQE